MIQSPQRDKPESDQNVCFFRRKFPEYEARTRSQDHCLHSIIFCGQSTAPGVEFVVGELILKVYLAIKISSDRVRRG